MSNRLGKLLSAILVASFAGGALVIAPHGARADDTCLSAPKAATPRGSHWYYRVEPGTKRHCWHLGDERGKLAQTPAVKPASTAVSEDASPARPAAPLQPAVANARAEFTSAAVGDDPATTVQSPPPTETVSAQNVPPPAPQTTNASQATVATRWPDPSQSPSIGAAQPEAAPAAAKPQPDTQLLGERTEPGPAVRIASAPAQQASVYSMPMLLGGLAGALAFAGIIGFSVVKFGSRAKLDRAHRRDGAIWDVVDAKRPPPWQHVDGNAATPAAADPRRDRRQIETPSRDILEILAKASQNATT